MHRDSIAAELPRPKTTEPKIAADCRREAIRSNEADIPPMEQMGSATLALIDEVFVLLGWKQQYVAEAILGVSYPHFNRAMNAKDGRVFDARWFDLLMLRTEFRAAYYALLGRKWGITHESLTDLLLQQAVSHLEFIGKLVQRTVVSE